MIGHLPGRVYFHKLSTQLPAMLGQASHFAFPCRAGMRSQPAHSLYRRVKCALHSDTRSGHGFSNVSQEHFRQWPPHDEHQYPNLSQAPYQQQSPAPPNAFSPGPRFAPPQYQQMGSYHGQQQAQPGAPMGHLPQQTPFGPTMGHLSQPILPSPQPLQPPTSVKVSPQNENHIKLSGQAHSLQNVAGSPMLPHASLTLQTNALGLCTVEFTGTPAMQALQFLQPGMRVVVTGRLAMAGNQMYIQGQQLQLVVDRIPRVPGTVSRHPNEPHRLSPSEQKLLSGFKTGRSFEEMAAEKGGKATANSLFTSLVELCGTGSPEIDPAALVPLAFTAQVPSAGLALDEVMSFLDSFLKQPKVEKTLQGSPKLTPIRDALLASSELGAKVQAQERSDPSGKGVTFNQLRLAISLLDRGVKKDTEGPAAEQPGSAYAES